MEIFNFFINQIDKKIWFKVFFNYILIFLLIISELLFLSNFFLLVNSQSATALDNNIINQINVLILNTFKNFSYTEIILIFLIFFLILKNILSLYQVYFQFSFVYKLTAEKASKLLKNYLHKNYEDFLKKDISIYIKQTTRDIEYVFAGIFGLIISILGDVVYVSALIFFSLSIVEIDINLQIILLLIIFALLINFLFSLSKKLGEIRGITEQNTFKFLSDTLRIFKEIKIKEKTENFINRFFLTYSRYFRTRVIQGIINLMPKFSLELLFLFLFFIFFINDSLTIDKFILKYSVFAIALIRLIPSVARLTSNISQIIYNLKSIEFIKKDIEKKVIKNTKNKNKIKNIQSLSLNKIDLKYYNKKDNVTFEIFKNFNYKFNKGNIYGIYGPSGSGKSSLLNIISGILRPNRGKVLINNKKIKSYDIPKLTNLSFASQDNVILDDNILVNITLNFDHIRSDINHIKSLLKYFNLNKFINKKFFDKKSLASIKNMSGGEMQRINFIRAIINNPKILILDEPTSSLDTKNEKKIFNYLKKIKKDKIIILTSHKLSQSKYFDKVIKLK